MGGAVINLLRRLPRSPITTTAAVNIFAVVASATGGLLTARSLGTYGRGQFAAVSAWFGLAMILCEVGQSGAVTYYVSKSRPARASYVRASTSIVRRSAAVTVVLGLCISPALSHGSSQITIAYAIGFCASGVYAIGSPFLGLAQATNLQLWNAARLSQAGTYLLSNLLLFVSHRLGLIEAVLSILISMVAQLAVVLLARSVLGPRADLESARRREVARFGISQVAAAAPAAVNSSLDQVMLSQWVRPSVLGKYSVALGFMSISVAAVSAIGNVMFPRLAAPRDESDLAARHENRSIRTALGTAIVFSLLTAAAVPVALPLLYGNAYRGAIPLVWILTPGTVCLALNQVLADLLRARGLPSRVARAQTTAALVTIIMLAVLLGPLGVLGAALTTTAAYGTASASMYRTLRRLQRSSPAESVNAGS